MKHTISAVALVGLALAFGSGNSSAKDNNGGGGNVSRGGHHSSSSTSAPSAPSTPHFNGTPHFSGATAYHPRMNFSNGSRTLNYPPVRNSTLRQQIYANHANSVLHQRSPALKDLNNAYALQRSGNFRQPNNISQTPKLDAARINRGHKLDPQTSARLRNWDGNISTAHQARLNHLNNCQHHHDHWWWRHHCATIIFFDFGWWGWYDGWWYPAWGYDPYSYYDYNEPIYGYNGESPEQIVAGVQAALQERGYYQYAIDGRMGPLTRAAISRFQSDHGLPISSGIDPATLGALGIIR